MFDRSTPGKELCRRGRSLALFLAGLCLLVAPLAVASAPDEELAASPGKPPVAGEIRVPLFRGDELVPMPVDRGSAGLTAELPREERARRLARLLVNPPLSLSRPAGASTPWPDGARFDSVALSADALVVRVELPERFLSGGGITDEWLERASRQLELAFGQELPEIHAFHLAARDPRDGAWKSLPSFLPPVDREALRKERLSGDGASSGPLVRRLLPEEVERGLHPDSSGVAPAAAGGLSGKQVFLSQCHGWIDYNTADAWETQRGITNGIVEDFVNPEAADQYLLRYLENSGANVFTLRESDMNASMVAIDSADGTAHPANGTYVESGSAAAFSNSGNSSWGNFRAPYAPTDDPFRVAGNSDRLIATAATETARATWTPVVPATGFYNVYVSYTRNGTLRANDAHYIVYHTGGATHFRVNQERHGWVWIYLGRFHFLAGSNPATGSVALANDSAQVGETVSADAVRFGGGLGDILGDYHSTVSGHPRWEEGARFQTQYMGGTSTVFGAGDVACRSKFAAWENYGGIEDSVFVSWHSNAFDTTARGTSSYIYSANPPDGTYDTTQAAAGSDALMHAIHDEIVNDVRAAWDATWQNRGYYSAYFGEINPSYNSEMPSTLLEVAFHDNATDATAMKDPRFRQIMARAIYQGIVKYFATRDGLAPHLLPEPPREPEAHATSSTSLSVSWIAPITDASGVYGDPAASYRVYLSANGYGFDGGRAAAGTSLAVTGLAPGTLYFLKVTAVNAGGESLPTEVLAVRTPTAMEPKVLVVNAFDRLDRSQLVVQNEPDLGGDVLRMYLDRMNDFSYAVQHATALAAAGVAVDTASNEAVATGRVALGGYGAVVWGCGEESTGNETFSSTEASLVQAYLAAGGRIFATGAEIGWDLDWLGTTADRAFYEGTLHCNYVSDDAGVYAADGLAGSILAGVTGIAFDDGTHGTYDVDYPDTLAGLSGGTSCLRYSTTASEAGIQVDTGTYRAVTFGFPFETIWDSSKRTTVMGKVILFLLPCVAPASVLSLPKATESGASVTLTLTDPNAPSSVTGYDVYRSSSASLAKGSWPAVATNVVDGDGGTTGIQWTDSSGATSPTGTWFYDAAAANARCGTEGPR